MADEGKKDGRTIGLANAALAALRSGAARIRQASGELEAAATLLELTRTAPGPWCACCYAPIPDEGPVSVTLHGKLTIVSFCAECCAGGVSLYEGRIAVATMIVGKGA